MQLSPHFMLEELTVSEYAARHDLDNDAPPSALDNLRKAAAGIESIRLLLSSRPIHVTRGYRSPAVNAGVGERHLGHRGLDRVGSTCLMIRASGGYGPNHA